MKIIILGAGAIGSFYGAKLSKFNDVTIVSRQEHVDKINKGGLKVTGEENNTYKLKAVTSISNIDENTLIILTSKVTGSKVAIESIINLIKKDTIILCLQNGLNSEDIVKDIVGDECVVLRGITAVGATFLENGIVQFNNLNYTKIEESLVSNNLVDNFNECGLKANVTDNLKRDVWKKLIINCVLNPLSAILRINNGDCANERLNPIKKLILTECLKVAKAEGVDVKIDSIEVINKAIQGSKNLSSMYQDIIKGKKTEIDYLNGAVVTMGHKYGIKCPINEGLILIIKGMEKDC